MLQEYKLTLTEAENLALEYVAMDAQDWIDNVVHHRCESAINEIVAVVVEECLKNNVQIPGSKEEIVKLGFSKQWVQKIKDRQLPEQEI